MASHWFNVALKRALDATAALASSDVRVLIAMTNTTADTEFSPATFGAITTLDEYDGATYARKTLAGEATIQDDSDNRAEFDADDLTEALANYWATLGAGTRQAAGLLVHIHHATPGSEIPLFWIDSGGFPFTGNGGKVEVTWHATDRIAYLDAQP